ncbi:MAG TPA: hypothetical protein VL307_05785 [Chitinophagaceae bacterium]|nr:hypothetical protein [Chitinophagaceae bacterium]
MKANYTQMEILLLTGTSFAAKQFADRNETDSNGRTEKEILTEACWSGVLPSLLPEICEQIPAGKKMYLWDIKEADAFIELEMGEMQEDKDKFFSLNPYSFIPELALN